MTRLEYLYLPFDESKGYFLSQKFGENPGDYPAANGHNGIDWGMFAYQPIYAAREGLVIRADYNPEGFGRCVVIQHYDSQGNKAGRTLYGHLRRIMISLGDHVEDHQLIGKSGGDKEDTYRGFSDGAHLHLSYMSDYTTLLVPGSGKWNNLDPWNYLRSWDLPDGRMLTPLYLAEITGIYKTYVRAAPDQGAATYGRDSDYMTMDEQVIVYQEIDGWCRISPHLNRWVNGRYVKRLRGFFDVQQPA